MGGATTEVACRPDGRNPNKLRPLSCSRKVLHRADGSARWSQGETIVLAAVYGPKAGAKKGDNPEKASIEVIWKPKTGQIDAGIPLKHLAVAISCGLTECGSVILDPTKAEEQKIQAFVYLAFPNSPLSVLPKATSSADGETFEHGIITSVTQGTMPVDQYFDCLEYGRAASAKISEFLRKSLHKESSDDLAKS